MNLETEEAIAVQLPVDYVSLPPRRPSLESNGSGSRMIQH